MPQKNAEATLRTHALEYNDVCDVPILNSQAFDPVCEGAGRYLVLSRALELAAAAAMRRRVRVLRLPPPDEPMALVDDDPSSAAAAGEDCGHERFLFPLA